jgi:hypothetical protein
VFGGVVIAGLTALSACTAPPRRLPARSVDDPITLPRKMVEAELAASAPLGHPEDPSRFDGSGPPESRSSPA